MTGTLDRGGQLTLMAGAGTGHAAGNDLSTLGQVAAQTLGVFIIDHLDLIGTESTNLSAGTTVTVHGSLGSFGTLHSHGSNLLIRMMKQFSMRSEGQVVIAFHFLKIAGSAAGIGGLGRGGGGVAVFIVAGAAAAGVTGLCAGEEHIVGHDLGGGALVAVFVLVVAGLDRTLHPDDIALVEIAADEFRLLTPGSDVDKVSLAFAVPAGKTAVHSDAEAAYRDPALGLLQLRVCGQATDENGFVKHYIISLVLFCNDERTDHAFSDLVDTIQLGRELVRSSEVDENIVAFLLVVDFVSQSALAPLIDGIDGAVGSNQIGKLLHQLGGGFEVDFSTLTEE